MSLAPKECVLFNLELVHSHLDSHYTLEVHATDTINILATQKIIS